jgi:hypothetical protein
MRGGAVREEGEEEETLAGASDDDTDPFACD